LLEIFKIYKYCYNTDAVDSRGIYKKYKREEEIKEETTIGI